MAERGVVVLADIHIDIMDYIAPAICADVAFRNMWAEFEWENKVSGSFRPGVCGVCSPLGCKGNPLFDCEPPAQPVCLCDPLHLHLDARLCVYPGMQTPLSCCHTTHHTPSFPFPLLPLFWVRPPGCCEHHHHGREPVPGSHCGLNQHEVPHTTPRSGGRVRVPGSKPIRQVGLCGRGVAKGLGGHVQAGVVCRVTNCTIPECMRNRA